MRWWVVVLGGGIGWVPATSRVIMGCSSVPSVVLAVFRWIPLVAWWALPGIIESHRVPLVVLGCYDAAVCAYALVRMQDHNSTPPLGDACSCKQ